MYVIKNVYNVSWPSDNRAVRLRRLAEIASNISVIRENIWVIFFQSRLADENYYALSLGRPDGMFEHR